MDIVTLAERETRLFAHFQQRSSGLLFRYLRPSSTLLLLVHGRFWLLARSFKEDIVKLEPISPAEQGKLVCGEVSYPNVTLKLRPRHRSQYPSIFQFWGPARFTRLKHGKSFLYPNVFASSSSAPKTIVALLRGYFLGPVIEPLYRFIRDQGYDIAGEKFVRRERGHESIIEYDEVNSIFWYPVGLTTIVLRKKSLLSLTLVFGPLINLSTD